MSAPNRIPLFPVGVVVERREAASQWADYTWRAVSVMPGAPEAEPWTVLGKQGEVTTFYAGAASVEMHLSETGMYRDNLATGAPSLWIIMTPTESDPPYRVAAVTADPSEGEAATETATNLVEAVPMPDVIRDWVAAFVAEHHVEREFYKRKRDRADPEALAKKNLALEKAIELARRGYGDHND